MKIFQTLILEKRDKYQNFESKKNITRTQVSRYLNNLLIYRMTWWKQYFEVASRNWVVSSYLKQRKIIEYINNIIIDDWWFHLLFIWTAIAKNITCGAVYELIINYWSSFHTFEFYYFSIESSFSVHSHNSNTSQFLLCFFCKLLAFKLRIFFC